MIIHSDCLQNEHEQQKIFYSVFLWFSFSIYEKLIQFCSIDELGTNYPKDMFDPHGWSEDSYYEALGKLMFFFFFTALCDQNSTLMYVSYPSSQSPESGDGQTGESQEGADQGESNNNKKREDYSAVSSLLCLRQGQVSTSCS